MPPLTPANLFEGLRELCSILPTHYPLLCSPNHGKLQSPCLDLITSASLRCCIRESPNAIMMLLTGLQSWPWQCCVLARANTKNLLWIAKVIAMVLQARESDRNYTLKAPSCIASAIAMQVANLLNSKCNTTCNLARARAMKLANLRKQARQTCRLAKASETNLLACKRDRNASCEHFCRSQTSLWSHSRAGNLSCLILQVRKLHRSCSRKFAQCIALAFVQDCDLHHNHTCNARWFCHVSTDATIHQN